MCGNSWQTTESDAINGERWHQLRWPGGTDGGGSAWTMPEVGGVEVHLPSRIWRAVYKKWWTFYEKKLKAWCTIYNWITDETNICFLPFQNGNSHLDFMPSKIHFDRKKKILLSQTKRESASNVNYATSFVLGDSFQRLLLGTFYMILLKKKKHNLTMFSLIDSII